MEKTAYIYRVETPKNTAFAELLIVKRDNKLIWSPSFGYECGSHRYSGLGWDEIESEDVAKHKFIGAALDFFKDIDFDEKVQINARNEMIELLQPTLFGLPAMKKINKAFCKRCDHIVDEGVEICRMCEYEIERQTH